MLSTRKQKILCLLVARYIETAQPVSSQDIVRDYGEEISSATIRSELAALERMGYLVQPHVSAGRIPTAMAYKLFVETIPNNLPSLPQMTDIKEYLDRRMDEVGDVIRSTAKVLSDVTNYTSVIVVKDIGGVHVRSVKLVDVGGDQALVVIITDSGVLKDCFIDIPAGLSENYLQTATDLLNRLFADKTVDEIRTLAYTVDEEIRAYKDILDQIINSLKRYDDKQGAEVFVEGTGKLLDYPEYNTEVENMRGVLSILDDKETLTDLVAQDSGVEIQFKIGKEDGIENASMVSAVYRIGDGREMHAGIIGPERMDYRRVVSIMRHLKDTIQSIVGDKKED